MSILKRRIGMLGAMLAVLAVALVVAFAAKPFVGTARAITCDPTNIAIGGNSGGVVGSATATCHNPSSLGYKVCIEGYSQSSGSWSAPEYCHTYAVTNVGQYITSNPAPCVTGVFYRAYAGYIANNTYYTSGSKTFC